VDAADSRRGNAAERWITRAAEVARFVDTRSGLGAPILRARVTVVGARAPGVAAQACRINLARWHLRHDPSRSLINPAADGRLRHDPSRSLVVPRSRGRERKVSVELLPVTE